MANTLPGTPYVESSDLVANYPAVSESLAERVDLVGILPFATSTARGTALPTPTDGQYTYLQDTNSTEFWNGSAWQSAGIDPGLQIVSPTSIANSGGSASASGGAVTFTGVSSVSLNGVFSSTYSNYKITINAPTNSGNLNFRMRTAGTDNSSSNYYFNGPEVSTSSTNTYAVARSNGLQTYWLTGGFSNGPVGVSLDIFDPQNTEKTRFVGIAISAGDTDLTGRFLTGMMSVTTSYDGLTLYPSSGTITGTIRVYGYKNS